ncbi:hypothetical protein AGRA3207_007313 [Actinomadura graeca]|uniref:NACHT domain-containing protein n=1 Tax=Actinomadura graeca TaxID=2750812 RepID=A0ABX8R7Q7_9ACTN|nr:hypothetical protein [Actinomadura graeca]QXJ25767.1 hypothetical protein AGRA3207_007313 [Actinomadura graeca]
MPWRRKPRKGAADSSQEVTSTNVGRDLIQVQDRDILTGDHSVIVKDDAQIHVHTAGGPAVDGRLSRPARSFYLRTVESIAPQNLVDRDAELAELTTFCKDDAESSPSYVWWRAPAWSGKSALMSWFVLHPPQGVRVVSFFITARFAGQSDRTAFLDVVLGQLAEITGEPEPSFLPEATRQSRFIQLLHEATATCAEGGEGLVLLVDGLDEDRGLADGQHEHSIAALLPVRPPKGLKLVLAGRPDPPIPTDVPAHHPLRDSGIIKALAVSDHAHVIRDVATHELESLLEDTGIAHDVLGLVVTAGGGLSVRDLAELTGVLPWKIERVLRGPSGRTFNGRASRWQPGTGPDVFAMAHEELRVNALAYLGGQALTGFKGRLDTWCDTYRDKRWPIGTPEYLLRDYLLFLRDHADTSRMIDLVVDRARFDRMLDVSGGDATALTEITATQAAINRGPSPDLAVCLRLALTRRYLTWRNSRIPPALPAAWACLGFPDRAEALAGSIVDPNARLQAHKRLAEIFVLEGERSRVEALVASIESENSPISGRNLPLSAHVLTSVVTALIQAGQTGEAEEVAHSIVDSRIRTSVQAALVTALATVGELDRAEVIANDLQADSEDVAWARKSLVVAFCASGDYLRAQRQIVRIRHLFPWMSAVEVFTRALVSVRRLDEARDAVRTAEEVVRSVRDPFNRASTRISLVPMLVHIGESARARNVIASTGHVTDAYLWRVLVEAMVQAGDFEGAESVMMTAPKPHAELQASQALVPALIEAGELDRAEASSRSLADETVQIFALCALVPAFAAAGDLDRAQCISAEVEIIARSHSDPGFRSQILGNLASVLATAGDVTKARAVAEAITEASARSGPFSTLLAKMVEIGDLDTAEAIFWTVTDAAVQDCALNALVPALLKAGCQERAQRIVDSVEANARSSRDLGERSRALGALALALAQAREFSGAEETIARITDTTARTQALSSLIPELIQQGEHERAEAIVHSIPDPAARTQAIISLMSEWLEADEPQRASAIIDTVEEAIELLVDSDLQTAALRALVPMLIRLNKLDRAERTARSIPDQVTRNRVLIAIVPPLMERGELWHALEINQEVETTARLLTDPLIRIDLLHNLVPVLIRARKFSLVHRIIRTAEDCIHTLPENFFRGGVLASHVRILVLAEDFSRVTGVIDSIDDLMTREHVCQAAIEALVSAGQFDRAEAIAGSAVDPFDRMLVVNKLIETLIDIGQLERAESASRMIAPSLLQTAASVLASAWSEAGDIERAEKIARSIIGSAQRAQALAEVARRAVPARRQRLLAEALAETPDVISLLTSIARSSPSALLENARYVEVP